MDDRLAYSAENCSIARTLGIVGEKWTLLVLRELFYGLHRFDDLHRAIGCARNLLAARLRTLEEHGVVQRRPYAEPGARTRHEYRLTEAGLELFPALLALMAWGDRHLADPAGPPVHVLHRGCSEPVQVVLRCAAGHDVAGARDTEPRPGPGALRAA